MLRMLTLMPFAGFIALISCSKNDPVDEDAVAVPEALAGDMSATGLAAPGNSSAREALRKAALPAGTSGLGWAYREQDGTALFGPPGTPAFSIQCQRPREGQGQLVFVRHLPPTGGVQATLSFTGNGKAASVPIAAVRNPDGLGGQWRAAVPPDDIARDIAEAFSCPGTVEVSLSGTPPLVAPANAEPRRVLADCLRG
jgi:hypothetical protein